MVLLLAALLLQDPGVLVGTIPEGVQASLISFSRDGKQVGYHARKGADLWITVGEWSSPPSPMPRLAVLLENGKDFVQVAFGREKSAVYFGEKLVFETTSSREWAWTLPGAVSSDGSVVANYVRNLKTGKSGVALNGKLQELHAGTGSSPALSRDGKTFAFALEKEDGYCIVINDKPGPLFDWVTPPVIAGAAGTVAYGADAGKEYLLILSDRKIRVQKNPKGVFISPDGKMAGYWGLAKKGDPKGGFQVIVGDREGPSFSAIHPPEFSPDGKHLVYRATQSDGSWVLVLDDRVVGAEGIQTDPVFLSDGKQVGYGVRKGSELRWKTLPVE